MLKNWIIYLVGPPGVGKLAVAKELARIAGCRVIDNHHWLNPVFGLIQQDGFTPLPAGIWPLTAKIRNAVLETAAHSPADWSFVFTHAAMGNPEHHPIDIAIGREIAAAAVQRGANRLAVRLTCSPDELARRVSVPKRRLQMKECDAEAARSNALREPFDPARQTAEHILAEAKEIQRGVRSYFP